MTGLHSIVAYLTPGLILLACVGIVQAVFVSFGCLVGMMLNFFHILEPRAAQAESSASRRP